MSKHNKKAVDALVLKVFIDTAHKTECPMLGLFIRDDGGGEYTFDGAFNLEAALAAALEENSK